LCDIAQALVLKSWVRRASRAPRVAIVDSVGEAFGDLTR
jgi:hypothetical protein